MACRTDDDPHLSPEEEEINTLVNLLCEACKLLNQSGVRMSQELKEWSRQHDIEDAKKTKRRRNELV